MTAHAEKIMGEIWREAGAKKTWMFQRNTQIIGTCRMGTDAAGNVVNENCRSFDVSERRINFYKTEFEARKQKKMNSQNYTRYTQIFKR